MNNFSYHDVVLPFVNASSGDQDKMLSLLEVLKELRTKSKIEDVTTERDNPDHALAVLRYDMPDKDKANINWLMSDKFVHKDTAWLTNTVLLEGFSGGGQEQVDRDNSLHAEFLLSAFKNKSLSPFSKLPTVILKKEASILALSLATFSPLASLIWEEALKTPEQIDDREILLAFQARANLSFMVTRPQLAKNVKSIVSAAALRLLSKNDLKEEDASLAAHCLEWSINQVEKKTVKENDRVVVIDNDLVRAMECVIKAGHESVLFAPRQSFGGVVLLSTALQVTPSKDHEAFVDKWLDYQEGWGKLGNVMDFPLSIDCLSFTKSQTKRFMHLLSASVIEELSQSSPAAPSNAFKIFKNLLDNIDQVQVFDDKESVKEWLSEIQLLLKNLSYEKTTDRNYYHHSTPSSKSRWRQMQDECVLKLATRWISDAAARPARKM